MDPLADQPLRAAIEAVAEPTPAPGAGSSCAIVCALAAALVEMAAGIGGGDPAAPRAARARALELAEVELSSYEPVLQAQRLPREDPGRGAWIEAALVEACGAPLEVAELAAQVADDGNEVAAASRVAVRGDALAGVTLAAAAAAAAARLVEINLDGVAAEGAGELRERANGAATRARAARTAAEIAQS